MIPLLANSLWLAASLPEHRRFHRATHRVAQQQEAILLQILRQNAETEFGHQHSFASIRSISEFQRQVPIRDYDQHLPWINRTAEGSPNILTSEPIRLFEPTSGSSGLSGPTKLIPYTASLQQEFQRAIQPWIADLFLHQPAIMGGQAYWSISPATNQTIRTSGGIPIGFENDTAYVGGFQQRLVQSVMAVPSALRLETESGEFQYKTLLHLVNARNLRLISIWNPTFLTVLLDRLPAFAGRICHGLATGEFGLPNPSRAREVQQALRASSPQQQYAQLWPNLKLISCWQDANSVGPAAQLQSLFPQAQVQGKGLIATEAFVSLPLTARDGSALAIRSHFFEFLPESSGDSLLAHQLERGARYTVVVTTGGGLYRYALGDQIEVTGRLGQCPLLRFLGRQNHVSDWFGEKLNEAHVARALQEVFQSLGISPIFAMLACDTNPPPAYVLHIESNAPEEALTRAAATIESKLRENFHYNYARQLGQLTPLRAQRIQNAAQTYIAEALRNGQKLGGIKFPSLHRNSGWSNVFSQLPVQVSSRDEAPSQVIPMLEIPSIQGQRPAPYQPGAKPQERSRTTPEG